MTKLLWAVIGAIAATATLFLLIAPEIADARWKNPVLNAFASHFADRPVRVQCSTTVEDYDLYYNAPDSWSLGYVYKPTRKQYDTYVFEGACLAALAVDLDVPEFSDWMKVWGTMGIVHEAFHLKRTLGAENEGVTQCRAMRHLDEAFLKLGAEPEVLDRLMPKALLLHFRFVAEVPVYNYKRCKFPARFNKYLGVADEEVP